MNTEKIKNNLEKQFVEDYDDLFVFMTNINDTLSELGIDSKYSSYNEFCLDIETHILQNEYYIITPKTISLILNNMIKSKIFEDEKYEEKLLEKFNNNSDLIINNIEKIKKKIQKL